MDENKTTLAQPCASRTSYRRCALGSSSRRLCTARQLAAAAVLFSVLFPCSDTQGSRPGAGDTQKEEGSYSSRHKPGRSPVCIPMSPRIIHVREMTAAYNKQYSSTDCIGNECTCLLGGLQPFECLEVLQPLLDLRCDHLLMLGAPAQRPHVVKKLLPLCNLVLDLALQRG